MRDLWARPDKEGFVTTRDGRTLYYPWGNFSRGYVVSSEKDAKRLHRRVKRHLLIANIVVLPLAAGVVDLIMEYMSGLTQLIMLVLLVLFSYGFMKALVSIQCRGLEQTDERLIPPL